MLCRPAITLLASRGSVSGSSSSASSAAAEEDAAGGSEWALAGKACGAPKLVGAAVLLDGAG